MAGARGEFMTQRTPRFRARARPVPSTRSSARSLRNRQARQAEMLAHIETGLTRRAAAGAAGVPTSTAYEWLNDPAFIDQVEAAEGRCERRVVVRVLEAIDKGSWRAGMDFLRHRWPERWRTHEAIEFAASLSLSTQSEADLLADIERFAKAAGLSHGRRSAPALYPSAEPQTGEIVGLSVAEEWHEPIEPPRISAASEQREPEQRVEPEPATIAVAPQNPEPGPLVWVHSPGDGRRHLVVGSAGDGWVRVACGNQEREGSPAAHALAACQPCGDFASMLSR